MDFKSKLPVGVQDFEKIREDGCLYIDRTSLIHKLVTGGSWYMLCRPRGFGKSLFLSALEAYFRGRRDLFEGLALESLESEWKEHDVLRLDFSAGVYGRQSEEGSVLDSRLSFLEKRYGVPRNGRAPAGERLAEIVRTAYGRNSRPVVVLIDGFDAPVSAAENGEVAEDNRRVLTSLLGALQGCDFYLGFVMIAGVTRPGFGGGFGGGVRFQDISMDPAYSEICGFNAEDLSEIASLCAEKDAPDDLASVLDKWYGGYRFGPGGAEVCCPQSVIGCLSSCGREDFAPGMPVKEAWAVDGQGRWLVSTLMERRWDLYRLLYGMRVHRTVISNGWIEDVPVAAVLYQSGYLTVAGGEGTSIDLAMPTAEVASVVLRAMLSVLTGAGECEDPIESLESALENGNMQAFMTKASELVSPTAGRDGCDCGRLAFHVLANLVGENVSSDANSDVMLTVGSGEDKKGYVFGLRIDRGLDVDDVAGDVFASMDERDCGERMDGCSSVAQVAVVFASDGGGISGWRVR